MSRTKITVPEHFSFSCRIPVRITDINYGGHVGNDSILSILHEARVQYFRQLGYTEMNFAGTGMIMTRVQIEFRAELFYGDTILASVSAGEISRIGFDLIYKLEVTRDETTGKKILAALATSGMICYDYEQKKIVPVPEEGKLKLQQP